MPKKKEPEFLDRIANPEKYPYITNKDGSISTHVMAAEVDEDGTWYVFPTIHYNGKELKVYKDNYEALDAAKATGNYLIMPSQEKAIEYAEGGYKTKKFEDFSKAIEMANKEKAKRAKAANTFKEALD